MNRIAQRRIIDDIKKHQRNSLYKKQINVLINKDVLNTGKRYLVVLNFLADQEKSLIDIFLHFFDSIYQIKVSPTTSKIQKPINYNKTFKFLVKLYVLIDKFLPRVVKPTQQEIVQEMDIVGNNKSFYLDGESTKANLQNFIYQQKMYVNNNFEQLLIQAKKTQKQSQQIVKYDIVLKMCQQQKQKTIQQIMNIEEQAIKSIYIPKQMYDMQRIYLQRLLDTLISIRFTKKLYRLTNFSNFIEKIYKDYYKTEISGISNIRDNSIAPKKFILKRYTNNDNQVLMNIFDLVQIRAKNIKYEQQSYQMSKQLLKQLIYHKNKTKRYYPYLSPTSVLLNQISLTIQLSFQNPLFNSLGLLQRPTNMENMVCFQATPKFYDSFAPINELMNPDLLTNYLIHIIKYLKGPQEDDNQYLNQHPLLTIQQKQGNKSEVWRFMMTVYYIMNGQQYYRGKQGKRIQTVCQFIKFLKQQESKLNNPSQIYYLQLLGTKFTNFLPRKNHKSEFHHNIYFFQDLFDLSEESNDEIKQYRSIKSHQYLKTYNKIIREILILIENHTISKVYNTVIYLLRFYIGIYKQFYQIYYLCRFCIKRVELGYKFLEDYMNKAQNQLSNLSKYHFEPAFSKLRQYKNRYERRRQPQIIYILQKYKQQIQGISNYYDLMVSIKSQLNLILLQASQTYTKINYQMKNDQIKQKILILKRKLGQYLYNLKRRIKKMINNQFFINQPHRQQNIKTKYNKNKLKLYTIAAFQMNFDNFIIIESIVLPLLNTGQLSNKNSRKNQKDIQNYNQLNDLCEYSIQILLDGSQQTDQFNQQYSKQNSKQQVVKQHRF